MRGRELDRLLTKGLFGPSGEGLGMIDADVRSLDVEVRANRTPPDDLVLCLGDGAARVPVGDRVGRTPDGPEGELLRAIGTTPGPALIPDDRARLLKLVVFVPDGYEERVFEAVTDAGAGSIGFYDKAAFLAKGWGRFRPLPGASPFIGEIGQVERVAEWRLETVIPSFAVKPVLEAMKDVHPYEEVAYDLIPLTNPQEVYGWGRRGRVGEAAKAADVAEPIRSWLGLPSTVPPVGWVRTLGVLLVPGNPVGGETEFWDVDIGVGAGPRATGARIWIEVPSDVIVRIRAQWLVDRLKVLLYGHDDVVVHLKGVAL